MKQKNLNALKYDAPLTRSYNVRMPEALRRDLDALAKRRGVKLSELVLGALRDVAEENGA